MTDVRCAQLEEEIRRLVGAIGRVHDFLDEVHVPDFKNVKYGMVSDGSGYGMISCDSMSLLERVKWLARRGGA